MKQCFTWAFDIVNWTEETGNIWYGPMIQVQVASTNSRIYVWCMPYGTMATAWFHSHVKFLGLPKHVIDW